jgi:hypothetical protein
LLDQKDIADLAVEDLRKWGQWDMADKVLSLKDTPVFGEAVVRRAVLRFALSCQDKNAAAKIYVEEQRKKDAQGVSDAEELLKLEQTPPAPVTPAAKAGGGQ